MKQLNWTTLFWRGKNGLLASGLLLGSVAALSLPLVTSAQDNSVSALSVQLARAPKQTLRGWGGRFTNVSYRVPQQGGISFYSYYTPEEQNRILDLFFQDLKLNIFNTYLPLNVAGIRTYPFRYEKSLRQRDPNVQFYLGYIFSGNDLKNKSAREIADVYSEMLLKFKQNNLGPVMLEMFNEPKLAGLSLDKQYQIGVETRRAITAKGAQMDKGIMGMNESIVTHTIENLNGLGERNKTYPIDMVGTHIYNYNTTWSTLNDVDFSNQLRAMVTKIRQYYPYRVDILQTEAHPEYGVGLDAKRRPEDALVLSAKSIHQMLNYGDGVAYINWNLISSGGYYTGAVTERSQYTYTTNGSALYTPSQPGTVTVPVRNDLKWQVGEPVNVGNDRYYIASVASPTRLVLRTPPGRHTIPANSVFVRPFYPNMGLMLPDSVNRYFKAPQYWGFWHFSRFFRPGMKVIPATNQFNLMQNGLHATFAATPDGAKTVGVLTNNTNNPLEVTLPTGRAFTTLYLSTSRDWYRSAPQVSRLSGSSVRLPAKAVATVTME